MISSPVAKRERLRRQDKALALSLPLRRALLRLGPKDDRRAGAAGADAGG